MLKDEIGALRQRLSETISQEKADPMEIYELSVQLDQLIMQYYQTQEPVPAGE